MQKIELPLLTDAYQYGRGHERRPVPPPCRPQLSPVLAQILKEVRRELCRQEQDGSGQASERTEELIKSAAGRLGFELNLIERDEILAQLESEQRPFGLLQPLVDDPQVSDIIVTDFAKISVQQGRNNIMTELRFPDPQSYEHFVERLLQRAGSAYSTKKPIADGMIGSLARVHAVHRSLCESGPYLTIRINRFSSVTIADLVGAGLAPAPVFHYLAALAGAGKTALVVGEVGTGKTTLVRALAGSLPRDQALLVIEDTPEIRLAHPHVRYISTREANSDGAGRVTPSECIRAGMRMAMNRIIFGEIRDAEAAEAFIDVCASGHPGLSTIHARSAVEAVARLELFLGRAQKGVASSVLAEQVVTAVQLVVHLDICRATGRRRVMQVREIGPVADGTVRVRDIFRYQPDKGLPAWKVVNRVSAHREILEQLSEPVVLASLPALLELDSQVLYREAATGLGGGRW